MTQTDETNRLLALLDAYGADVSHWPAPERGTFSQLSVVAPLAVKAAEDVDALLASVKGVVAVPLGLADKVMKSAPQPQRTFAGWTPKVMWGDWRAIVAASIISGLSAGLALGVVQANSITDEQTADDIVSIGIDNFYDSNPDSEA